MTESGDTAKMIGTVTEVLSEEQRQRIVKKLSDVKANNPCPRCNNSTFTLVDGFFSNVIQSNLSTMQLSGQNIPVAAVICTNCGYVAMHALGVLGLLEN